MKFTQIMKKLFLIVLFAFSFIIGNAQTVEIPKLLYCYENNFHKQYIVEEYSKTCKSIEVGKILTFTGAGVGLLSAGTLLFTKKQSDVNDPMYILECVGIGVGSIFFDIGIVKWSFGEIKKYDIELAIAGNGLKLKF